MNVVLICRVMGSMLLLTALVGCVQKPDTEIAVGEILLEESFDNTVGWDLGSRDNVRIGVEGSAYRIQTDMNTYVRGFNSTRYENVVIDVTISQYSAEENNAYGVVCRGTASDDSSNGYYFLIGGDGTYTIRIGRFGEINGLVRWTKSGAVNQGSAINRIRVVCVEDYLALYINDQFAADAHDTTYSGGYIGFAAASAGTILSVAFDDLVIREGKLSR